MKFGLMIEKKDAQNFPFGSSMTFNQGGEGGEKEKSYRSKERQKQQ